MIIVFSLFTLCTSYRCLNADPNYGTSWFFFRDRPIDTPGVIIDTFHSVLNGEFTLTEPLYVRAMVSYIASVIKSGYDDASALDFDFSAWLMDWASVHPCMEAQSNAPLKNIDGMMTFSSQDFITGTVHLSRIMCTNGRQSDPPERREMLYGSDQITP